MQYIFIEKEREALDYLRQVLADSKYAPLVGDRVQLIHGEFAAQVPKITKLVKNRGLAGRAIFVLDQFGYTEVPLPTIRSILTSLDNAEVILTFATDFLINYLSESKQTQRMSTPAFEPHLQVIVSSCGLSGFQMDGLPSWTGQAARITNAE